MVRQQGIECMICDKWTHARCAKAMRAELLYTVYQFRREGGGSVELWWMFVV